MILKALTFFFFFFGATYLIYSYYTSNLHFLAYFETHKSPVTQLSEQCDPDIAPFYIYNLADRFNEALLSNCSNLDPWMNMCTYIDNHGMGQLLNKSSWYNTYQFNADMLFHARAINHPCRTHDVSSALMFYIPFYASLYAQSVFYEYNLTRRDTMAVNLVDYLLKLPTFQRHGGHDHFLVSGLMAWDFLRGPDQDAHSTRSNNLLNLPQLSNLSILINERNTYHGDNQFGIPYPSYFHPKSKDEITSWQDEVRRLERTHLFSFVGGARHKGHNSEKYRSAVINQCNRTESCILILCKYWGSAWDAADEILGALKRARFCLQPPGDTMTRRSIFDSILVGCVPVFFSDLTAYEQYTWYIPERREDWSVMIGPDQLDRIEEVLSQIPEKEIERMREVVIGMIPRVTYTYPNATRADIGFRDAVDTALVELTKWVRRSRRAKSATREEARNWIPDEDILEEICLNYYLPENAQVVLYNSERSSHSD
ncbi:xyloglucan galactosyltransferase KATAMARI1 [Carex littledalei]|uniref:Xyloglucan galactosyltransferase KATAMARI1 n=1 Tax=Carex littledalei TaxID=544730 RepID=A0A833VFS0_9POAL|nr:xyloglucan galactosyltransferase KATAMARI1 [Carex littledalei]